MQRPDNSSGSTGFETVNTLYTQWTEVGISEHFDYPPPPAKAAPARAEALELGGNEGGEVQQKLMSRQTSA